jgi:hypothetical protein
MALTVRNSGKKRELIPAGTYIARCYQMIDIGTVPDKFNGDRPVQKVRIGWELPTELRIFDKEKGPQPHVIFGLYTFSLHEKSSLSKILVPWRGKGFSEEEIKDFDITYFVGLPCMLTIIHKENNKGYINPEVSSVAAMPKGVIPEEPILKPFVLTYDKWDQEKFDSLPLFIKEMMELSEEYKALKNPVVEEPATMSDPETDDGLPF